MSGVIKSGVGRTRKRPEGSATKAALPSRATWRSSAGSKSSLHRSRPSTASMRVAVEAHVHERPGELGVGVRAGVGVGSGIADQVEAALAVAARVDRIEGRGRGTEAVRTIVGRAARLAGAVAADAGPGERAGAVVGGAVGVGEAVVAEAGAVLRRAADVHVGVG